VNEYFDLPFISNKPISIKIEDSIVDHINNLWNILSRPSDKYIEGSYLIPLPYPYVVPGGRFRQIFYWD
jgi:alpha,alpha-trehalase